jgi:hypothetical protein
MSHGIGLQLRRAPFSDRHVSGAADLRSAKGGRPVGDFRLAAKLEMQPCPVHANLNAHAPTNEQPKAAISRSTRGPHHTRSWLRIDTVVPRGGTGGVLHARRRCEAAVPDEARCRNSTNTWHHPGLETASRLGLGLPRLERLVRMEGLHV